MSRFIQRGRHRSADRRRQRGSGQTLVEFALVLPIFMLILMGVVEFGFLLNSFLAINFASREASLIAAEAGDESQADCLILRAIDQSVNPPASNNLITRVEIYRFRGGSKTATTVYERGGPIPCDLPGTLSVPYASVSNGYPPVDRCNRLSGCPTNPAGVDQIGVEVHYSYRWHTPLGGLFGGSSGATPLVKGNVMRMEPVL